MFPTPNTSYSNAKEPIVSHLKQALNAEYQGNTFQQFIENLKKQSGYKSTIEGEFPSQQELRKYIFKKIPQGAVINQEDKEVIHIIFDPTKQIRVFFGDGIKQIIHSTYFFWNILRIESKIQIGNEQEKKILSKVRQFFEQIIKQMKLKKNEETQLKQIEKTLIHDSSSSQAHAEQIQKVKEAIKYLKQKLIILLQNQSNQVEQINKHQIAIAQKQRIIGQLSIKNNKITSSINQNNQIKQKLSKKKQDFQYYVEQLQQLLKCQSIKQLIEKTFCLYTKSFYIFLNAAFASTDVVTQIRMRHLLQIMLFNFRYKLIGKNLKERVTLYRNIRLPKRLLSLYKQSNILYFTHLTSFSRLDLKEFSKVPEKDKDKYYSVRFLLELPNFAQVNPKFYSGLNISQFSLMKGQQEVLLPPYIFFKVLFVQQVQQDLKFQIKLQEIESKELIEKIEQPKVKAQSNWKMDEKVLIKELSSKIQQCRKKQAYHKNEFQKLIKNKQYILYDHIQKNY